MRRILLALFCLCFVGCAPGPWEPIHYTNVQRVFMHEPGRYTILVDGKIVNLRGHHGDNRSTIYADVPAGEPMWVKGRSRCPHDGQLEIELEIHIHSFDDVGGGGFDDGTKFHRPIGTRVVQ